MPNRRFRSPRRIDPIRKFKVWIIGLKHAMDDFAVFYKVALSVVLLALFFLVKEWVNFLIIFVATGQVLMAEVFNNAIEVLCDYIEPRRNEMIRIIKDISASAVGISFIVWLFVLLYEIHHLWVLYVKGVPVMPSV